LPKLRVYLETTVFNYYFDTDRDGHAETVQMFEAIGRGEYEGYTSRYATYELENAPEPKQSNMMSLITKYGIKELKTNDEAVRLANIYLSEGALPAKCALDSAHIAIATIHSLDCVLSFNFGHDKQKYNKREDCIYQRAVGI